MVETDRDNRVRERDEERRDAEVPAVVHHGEEPLIEPRERADAEARRGEG